MNLTLVLVICSIVTVIVGLGGVAVKWILKEISDEATNRAASSTSISRKQDDIKADLKAVTDGHERRLDRLETSYANYMPRDEIKAAFAHDKAGRDTLNDAMMRFYQRNADDIVAVKVEVGRLEQQHNNTARELGEIKESLKDQRNEIKDQRIETNLRLDALQKCVNDIARNVQDR